MNEEIKVVLYRILYNLQTAISDHLEEIINSENQEEKKIKKERIEGLKEAENVIRAFVTREERKEKEGIAKYLSPYFSLFSADKILSVEKREENSSLTI